MNFDLRIDALVAQLAPRLLAKGWMLATAESCTGGGIATACTALAGSSAWFERGFVSYSNAAKTECLGVPAHLFAAHGAVSEQVARAMAAGALAHSHANVAVAVTGVAGPGGASDDKPVGTVWLAWAVRLEHSQWRVSSANHHFAGDRAGVRLATIAQALAGLCELT